MRRVTWTCSGPIYIYLWAAKFLFIFLARTTMFTTFEVRRHQVHRHHCSASRRPPCKHPMHHKIGSNRPQFFQDQRKGQDGSVVSARRANAMGSSECGVGSTRASCLDDVVVAWVAPYSIMWEADVAFCWMSALPQP